MPAQSILLVALPDGFADRPGGARARLSVFVAPRLTMEGAEGTLVGFPDFVDWPARLAAPDARFALDVGGARVPATVVSAADSAVWRALFPPDTLVRSHAPEALSDCFATYPAARIHDRLQSGYQELAVAAAEPLSTVTAGDLRAAFGSIRPAADAAQPGSATEMSGEDERQFLAQAVLRADGMDEQTAHADRLMDLALDEARTRRGTDAGRFTPVVPDLGDDESAFAQLLVFHTQPTGRQEQTAALEVDPPPPDRRLDFHQRLTALHDYPALLRKLGIVIDLEVDAAAIPEAKPGAPELVRVVADFLAADGAEPPQPATAYIAERDRSFVAAPAPDGETADGLIPVRQAAPGERMSWRVAQFDLDAAGLRTLDLLGRLAPLRDDDPAPPMPALRTTGLSLLRERLAEELHAGFERTHVLLAGRGTGDDVVFTADDLLRGYRMDVRSADVREWRSLHARIGRYVLRDGTVLELTDEGAVAPALVQTPAASGGGVASSHDPTRASFASEALCVWDGWSLSAPRPGAVLPSEAALEPASTGGRPMDERPAMETLPLTATFRPVPRSLPRLRFGQPYEVRLRTVDLAGNGPALAAGGDAPEPPAGAGWRFLRAEPVGSPRVSLVGRAERNDPLSRIVLRSGGFDVPGAPTVSEPERDLAPPAVPQVMAERHGRFDASIGAGRDLARTHAIANRAAAGRGDERRVADLPDPLAAGVTLRGVPGVPAGRIARVRGDTLVFEPAPLDGAAASAGLVLIGFPADPEWPDVGSVRLRLAAGEGPPAWEAATRTLVVRLPPAAEREVHVSCHLSDEAPERLALWDWTVRRLEERAAGRGATETARDAERAAARQAALFGLNPMLTPARALLLVHAVAQPVEAPVTLGFRVLKRAGGTAVWIGARVAPHLASTGRLELNARWTEPVEGDPARPPEDVELRAAVLAVELPAAPPDAELALAPSVTLGADGVVTVLPPPFEAKDAGVLRAIDPLVEAARQAVRTNLGSLELPGLATFQRVPGMLAAITRVMPLHRSWGELETVARAAENAAEEPLPEVSTEELPPGLSVPTPQEIANASEAQERVAAASQSLRTAVESAAAVRGLGFSPHELGDPRHRRVTYEWVAVSRFGDSFPGPRTPESATAEAASPPPAVRPLAGAPVTIDVPSSARPAAPRVQYVVPSFAWRRETSADGTRTSERRGGLRVYLERPWFSSGQGELLAVVLREPATAGASPEPPTSDWGRDPIRRSASPSTPLSPARFREPAAVLSGLQPAETERRSAARVTAVGYPPSFDAEGRCFCDLDIDPGDAYFPFVRLALARLQPNALPGLELSDIVVADFAQLVPDRVVTSVRRDARTAEVRVAGPTHASPTDPTAPDGSTGTRVRATVQRRLPGTIDDAGWIDAPDAAVITEIEAGVEAAVPLVRWAAVVALAVEHPPGELRLLIEELEAFPGDGGAVAERVVFAEEVPL